MKQFFDGAIVIICLLGFSAIVYCFLDLLVAATKFLKAKTGPQTIYQVHTNATVEEIKAARWDKGRPVAPQEDLLNG